MGRTPIPDDVREGRRERYRRAHAVLGGSGNGIASRAMARDLGVDHGAYRTWLEKGADPGYEVLRDAYSRLPSVRAKRIDPGAIAAWIQTGRGLTPWFGAGTVRPLPVDPDSEYGEMSGVAEDPGIVRVPAEPLRDLQRWARAAVAKELTGGDARAVLGMILALPLPGLDWDDGFKAQDPDASNGTNGTHSAGSESPKNDAAPEHSAPDKPLCIFQAGTNDEVPSLSFEAVA